MKNKNYILRNFHSQRVNRKFSGLLRVCLLLLLTGLWSTNTLAQNVAVSGANVGDGSYATLQSAFAAINVAGNNGSGPISVVISNSTTETTTAQLDNFTWASVTVTATVPVTVQGPIVGAIVKLNGADNVTIDGRIGGIGRNITIQNNNSTSSSTAAVWLASVAAGNGATNNTIRNCNIACGAPQNAGTLITIGVLIGGTTISVTAATGLDNDNNSIIDNAITKCRYGISTRGQSATNLGQSNTITDNLIGPASFGADQIGKTGILAVFENNCTISRNEVRFVGGDFANTTAGADRFGIGLGTESWSHTNSTTTTNTNFIVTRNLIHDIIEERTFSACGIVLSTTNGTSPTNDLICSNMIYNVKANGTSGDQTAGIGISGGHTIDVVHNSIYLYGDVDPNPSATSTSMYGAGIRVSRITSTSFANLNIRNNAIHVDLSSSSVAAARYYAISCQANTMDFETGGLDYNDYYVNPLNTQCVLGGIGTTLATAHASQFPTLGGWQGVFAIPQDANSISANPNFISLTNLHSDVGSTVLNDIGTPIATCAVDFDDDARSGSPDIGADEYSPLVCTGAAGGTISPTTVELCAGQTYNMTSVGADVGAGITYQWEISATGGGAGFGDVTGGIGANTVSYITDALTPGVYYYRLRVECSNGPFTGYSDELTVTVNSNPVVSVDVPSASYCNPNGAAVTINASGASTYAWLPIAGLDIATGATVIATPTATTTYTVTGTDGNGCTATATSLITVQTGVTISSVTSTPSTVCSGSNSQLQVNATSAGANTAAGFIYTATTGSFETIPSPVNLTVPTIGTADDGFETINTTGSFDFNFNGVNHDNFTIGTNGYVVINGTPALNGIPSSLSSLATFNVVHGFGRDGNINVTNGGSINHGLDGSGTKYVFEFVNYAIASGGAESATQFGNMQIILWGNTSSTPGRVDLVYGTSLGSPATNGTIGIRDAAGTRINGVNGSTTLTTTTNAFPTDGTMYTFEKPTFSYLWTPSDFIAGQETLPNPLATGVTATTAYNVIATAVNGCSASGNVTVTAEPLVCAPAIAGPINCANTNFTVTANHTGGGSPYNYSWNDGNGGVYPDAISITANLPAGSYTFTCTVSDACGNNCTSSVSVTVNALPTVTVTPNSGLICNPGGTPIALTASGAPSFAWSPASGLSATTGDNVTANPSSTVTYTVIGTDANGCTSTATAAITVNLKANITATASPDTICIGDQSTLTAVSGTTGSATVGTATTSIGGVNGNPYRSGNGNGNQIRTQLLYTAAELIAAGVQPGPLSSIGFTTQSSSTGTVINFSIALGSTNVTALTSTFETSSVTTVFTQASFAPLSSGLNNHVFNAGSFSWDGVSNILVNVCQTNSITGTATVSAFTPATLSNNHRSTLTTSCSELTGTTVANKPIVTFGWTSNTSLFTWEWQPGSLSGNSVSVNPVSTTTYTVTATSAAGCTSTADVTVTALPNVTYYQDADNDTYGNPAVTQVSCIGAPVGYVIDNTDCDDGNAAVNPAATEVCNLIDDNCDGNIDEGFDVDNDGYTSCNGDCNDNDNTINPGATEICNGIDDNCNGLTDDNVPALPNVGAISGTATACLPGVAGSTSFSIDPVVGATTYVWSVPSGFTIASGQGTTSIMVAWTATAMQNGISGALCIYAADACVSTSPSCVTIDYQVAAPVTPPSISGPGKVCTGDVVVYSIALVNRATSYTWTVPATMTITSGQGTNVITASVDAGYIGGSVSVVASNVCGTSPTRSKSLTQNFPATPTAIQGQKEGLCNTIGNAFSIPAVANATSYNWGITGGTIASGQGTTGISVDGALLIGSCPITVHAVNGCGTSLTQTLTINGSPARPEPIAGNVSVCDNTTEPYSVATVAGADSYTWVVSSGSVSSGQGTKNITIDWAAPAVGQTMSVTTANACGSSLTRSLTGITVNNCPRFGMNADQVNLNAFPNPASDRATIQFTSEDNSDYRLRISDVTGRTLFLENGTAAAGLNTKVLSLDGLASGVYNLTIEMLNAQQQIKLIVE
ncbi:MAG: T9SS type A sorting domain-containing protein [Bacteroidetes bacterium]|nr:T9SS type A sorting domain-containing protein [Bacteroidota bacterium]